MLFRLDVAKLDSAIMPSTLYPTQSTLKTISEERVLQQRSLLVRAGQQAWRQQESVRGTHPQLDVNIAKHVTASHSAIRPSRTSLLSAHRHLGSHSPSGVHRSLESKKIEYANARSRAPYAMASPSVSAPSVSNAFGEAHLTRNHSGSSIGVPALSSSLSPNHHRHMRHNSGASVSSFNTIPTPTSAVSHSRTGSLAGSYIPSVSVAAPDEADVPLSMHNSLELDVGRRGSNTSSWSQDFGMSSTPIEIPQLGSPSKPSPSYHSHIQGFTSFSHNREGKIAVDHDLISRSFRSLLPTDARRRRLLDKIQLEAWFVDNKLEPQISGLEDDPLVGGGLLTGTGPHLHHTMQGGEELGERGKSVYRVFLRHAGKEWLCLFGNGENGRFHCSKSVEGQGYKKPERAVEHIRSHLGHRPYWCDNTCGSEPAW